jgi:hypothetical protein
VNFSHREVLSFGVQGWTWGEPRPKSITFFLDGTAKVSDQHGRPIRGTVVDNKEVRFADAAPIADRGGDVVPRPQFASHAQVIAALAAERVDWLKLDRAGWPQLPYDELVKLAELPPTPLEELRKIRDPQLRKDALRARREADDARSKEMQEAEQE